MVAIIILAFFAGSAVIFGVNLLYADVQNVRLRKLREQIQQESRLVQRDRANIALANQPLYEMAAMNVGDNSPRESLRERIELFFEQSGIRMRPMQVALLAIPAMGLFSGGTWLSTRSWLLAVAAGLAGSIFPCLYVLHARHRRLRLLLNQLPEAFDLISRMMRAGRTFPQALQSTADDGFAPLSEEFGYCSDQQQLGMSPNAALRDLARRTGLLEIKIFVLAVSIHRQSGGNLSELLEKLADVTRARQRTEGLVNSCTSEARLQIFVLTALPVLALIVMSFVSPQNAKQLYDRPWLLVGTAASMSIGWFWMKRIVNFSY